MTGVYQVPVTVSHGLENLVVEVVETRLHDGQLFVNLVAFLQEFVVLVLHRADRTFHLLDGRYLSLAAILGGDFVLAAAPDVTDEL